MRARICSVLSCDMFARVVWLRLRRAAKLPTFDLSLATHARHALLLATNSCTPHGGSEGGRRESSLLTFGILRLGDAVQRWLRHPEPSSSSLKSTRKEKVSLCLIAGEQCSPPVSATPTHMLRICVNSPTMRIKSPVNSQKTRYMLHPPVSATPTHMLRICVNSRFFFCICRRKRKSY